MLVSGIFTALALSAMASAAPNKRTYFRRLRLGGWANSSSPAKASSPNYWFSLYAPLFLFCQTLRDLTTIEHQRRLLHPDLVRLQRPPPQRRQPHRQPRIPRLDRYWWTQLGRVRDHPIQQVAHLHL